MPKLTCEEVIKVLIEDGDLDGEDQPVAVYARAIYARLPDMPDLDAEVYQAIKENPEHFSMATWHSLNRDLIPMMSPLDRKTSFEREPTACGTTHCIAGWACVLSGAYGKTGEADTALLARILYLKNTGSVPDFFGTDAEALEELRARAEKKDEVQS